MVWVSEKIKTSALHVTRLFSCDVAYILYFIKAEKHSPLLTINFQATFSPFESVFHPALQN